MKQHITNNVEIKNIVLQGLKQNKGYCPCIVNSIGKPQYKCMCQDFRENKKIGEACHCGLFIKDEM